MTLLQALPFLSESGLKLASIYGLPLFLSVVAIGGIVWITKWLTNTYIPTQQAATKELINQLLDDSKAERQETEARHKEQITILVNSFREQTNQFREDWRYSVNIKEELIRELQKNHQMSEELRTAITELLVRCRSCPLAGDK